MSLTEGLPYLNRNTQVPFKEAMSAFRLVNVYVEQRAYQKVIYCIRSGLYMRKLRCLGGPHLPNLLIDIMA